MHSRILTLAILAALADGSALAAGPPTQTGSQVQISSEPVPAYKGGRPTAKYRLNALDQGVVLPHGDGPGKCDYMGARDIWVFESGGTYYIHYVAAGPTGWVSGRAGSR